MRRATHVSNIGRFIGTRETDHFFMLAPTVGGQGYYIFGGDGDDTIQAFGGVMRGGGGNNLLFGIADLVETFWLELHGGTDTLVYFVGGEDKIRISGKEFGIGALLNSDELFNRSADANPTGTKAQFIFRDDTDQLYFDSDGTGSDAAVLLAYFSSTLLGLALQDFEIA